jgi:FkbM family methyltransferase
MACEELVKDLRPFLMGIFKIDKALIRRRIIILAIAVFIFLQKESFSLQTTFPQSRTRAQPFEYPTLMLRPKSLNCYSRNEEGLFPPGCLSSRIVTAVDGTQFFAYDSWPVRSDYNLVHGDLWDRIDRNAWEPHTYKVLKTVLVSYGGVEGGAEYLDFGAWIGPTVLFAAHFASRVWTLEPDTMAAEMLIANFEIPENADIRKKTRVFHECIAEKAGILKIQGLGQSGSRINRDSIVKFEHEVSGGKEWNIPCRSLPQFYQEEGMKNLRLVKMDVEGAEMTVLPSLGSWFQELDQNKSETGGKPAFWISLHRPYWANAKLSNVCAVWRTFSLWKFIYNVHLVDVTSSFRISPDREMDGEYCNEVLCASFCEYLLTDKQFSSFEIYD